MGANTDGLIYLQEGQLTMSEVTVYLFTRETSTNEYDNWSGCI